VAPGRHLFAPNRVHQPGKDKEPVEGHGPRGPRASTRAGDGASRAKVVKKTRPYDTKAQCQASPPTVGTSDVSSRTRRRGGARGDVDSSTNVFGRTVRSTEVMASGGGGPPDHHPGEASCGANGPSRVFPLFPLFRRKGTKRQAGRTRPPQKARKWHEAPAKKPVKVGSLHQTRTAPTWPSRSGREDKWACRTRRVGGLPGGGQSRVGTSFQGGSGTPYGTAPTAPFAFFILSRGPELNRGPFSTRLKGSWRTGPQYNRDPHKKWGIGDGRYRRPKISTGASA